MCSDQVIRGQEQALWGPFLGERFLELANFWLRVQSACYGTEGARSIVGCADNPARAMPQVLDAIKARPERRTRYYLSELKNGVH